MFYRIIWGIAWVLMRLAFSMRRSGFANIPKKGHFILCANHISAFDPILIAVLMRRRCWFLGKKELFANFFGRIFFRGLGAIPVDRKNTDMRAFRECLNVLAANRGLLVFSQGTRMKRFEGAKAGVALFALRSGAPIIPVGISGRYRFRARLDVRVGEPIHMDEFLDKKINSELVDAVMARVVPQVAALVDA